MKLPGNATIHFVLLASLFLVGVEARLGKVKGNENNGHKQNYRVLQILNLEGFGSDPTGDNLPLLMCQGDCDDDDDCDEGLVCFQRGPGEAVPGCLDGENEMSMTDFCIMAPSEENISTPTPTAEPTSTPTKMPFTPVAVEDDAEDVETGEMPEATFVGNDGDWTGDLQLCESDCDIDDDCADGLICYQRERGQPIPGCLGVDSSRNDYCILAPDLEPTTTTAPSITSNTTNEDEGIDFFEEADFETGPETTNPTNETDIQDQLTLLTPSPTALLTNTAVLPTKSSFASPTAEPTEAISVPANFAALPTKFPAASPTDTPTESPTGVPTGVPTGIPTNIPTESPTSSPSKIPTSSPTSSPTEAATTAPTETPTVSPTATPTTSPTVSPTVSPTILPTAAPTAAEGESDFPLEDDEVMDTLPEAVLVGNNNDPAFFPLGKCQGDCDNNDECAPGLLCFQRRNEEAIPGCSTPDSELYGIDFCVDPADLSEKGPESSTHTMVTTTGAIVVSSSVNTSPTNLPPTNPARTRPAPLPALQLTANNAGERLGECQGDCDSDNDCLPGLMCMERNDRRAVPGCSTTGIYGADYCIKDPNPTLTAEDIQTSSPSAEVTFVATSTQTALGSM